MKIPEYFKDREICCPCCGKVPDKTAVYKLYCLRLLLDVPIIVTSGARCEKYNKKIGGSKNSYHIAGHAFDIKTKNQNADEYNIIKIAQQVGFTGIGINNNNFIHIDNRFMRAIWTY